MVFPLNNKKQKLGFIEVTHFSLGMGWLNNIKKQDTWDKMSLLFVHRWAVLTESINH